MATHPDIFHHRLHHTTLTTVSVLPVILLIHLALDPFAVNGIVEPQGSY